MKHYIDQVQGTNGIVVVGAVVTVRVKNASPGTGALATIYSDDGITAIAGSAVTTDTTGTFSFWAPDGRYDLVVTVAGFSKTVADIEISDITETNIGDGTANFGTITVAGLATLANVNGVINAGNFATFALALAACPNPGTLSISTPITVSANAAVPVGITLQFLQGGRLNIATATTVTINSAILAPEDAQIFSLTGTGTVAGLSTTRPEWFGGRAAVNVQAAYNSLLSTGGNILFRDATYVSPWISHATEITKSNVELVGSGQPEYNSQTAPTALTAGGTIIQGPIWAMADQNGTPANGLYIHDLGVDVGSAVCTALFAGVGQNAIFVNNNFPAGVADGPPFIEGVIIENVTTLGQSAAAAFHSILVDNGDGTRIQNVRTFFDVYGVVSKGKRTTVDGVYARGHSLAGAYIKSDTNFGISQDASLSNIHITQAATAYDTAGLIVESQAVVASKGVAVTNYTARGLSFALSFSGTSIVISELTLSNFTIDNVQGAINIGATFGATRALISNGTIINSTTADAIVIGSASIDTSISNVFINSVVGSGINNAGIGTKVSNVSVKGASVFGVVSNGSGTMSVEGLTGSGNVSGLIGASVPANLVAATSTHFPNEVATFDAVAQGAAVATTTLYAVPAWAAGQYRMSWNSKITQAATTSSVLGPMTITYTDPDGVAITTIVGAMINGGSIQVTGPTNNNTVTLLMGVPILINAKASTNITFSFAYASVGATPMQYNLHLKLESL